MSTEIKPLILRPTEQSSCSTQLNIRCTPVFALGTSSRFTNNWPDFDLKSREKWKGFAFLMRHPGPQPLMALGNYPLSCFFVNRLKINTKFHFAIFRRLYCNDRRRPRIDDSCIITLRSVSSAISLRFSGDVQWGLCWTGVASHVWLSCHTKEGVPKWSLAEWISKHITISVTSSLKFDFVAITECTITEIWKYSIITLTITTIWATSRKSTSSKSPNLVLRLLLTGYEDGLIIGIRSETSPKTRTNSEPPKTYLLTR